jgi:solute carrier family 25 protein 44
LKQFYLITDAAKKIYRGEGIRGFYRGFGATLLTGIPGSAIWWTTYEHFKAVFSERLNKSQIISKNNNGMETVLVGQHRGAQLLAGMLAGAITSRYKYFHFI